MKNRIIQKKILDLFSPQDSLNLEGNKFKKILFFPLSATDINSLRESIIGLACQARGADISMLYLDTNLPIFVFRKDLFGLRV